MFKPLQYDSGKAMKIALAISQTVVKGDALEWADGYLQVGTTTSTDIRFVALEDVTTGGSSHTECLVLPVEGVRFEADCDAAAVIANVGTYADLADEDLVNPDSSDYDAFYIDELVGKTAVSTVVRGHFVHVLE